MLYVYLHGWSFNSAIWPEQNAAIFAPNLYAYKPPLTFANIACQLHADLKQFNDELTIVGWSMGGSIALELVSNYADLEVSSLRLLASTAKFVNSEDYSSGVSPVVARQLRQRIVKDTEQGLAFFQSLLGSEQGSAIDFSKESVVQDQAKLLQTLDELYHADYRQVLLDLNMPTLVVHGDQDLVCPVGSSKYLAAHLPKAKLRILKNTGHLGAIQLSAIR